MIRSVHQLLRPDALDDPGVRFLAIQRWQRRLPHAQQALQDSFRRVDRAVEHKAWIEGEIRSWLKTADSGVEVQAANGGQQIRLINHGAVPPPRSWSIVTGEVVHNLRAAFDYAVYGLAWMATGGHVEKTQFPICDSPENLKGQMRHIRRLVPSQVQVIEGLQPYDDRPTLAWLRTLRDLSNQDKHRALNLTIPQGSGCSTLNYDVKDQCGNPTVEQDETIGLVFDSGKPVIDVLNALCDGVKQILDGLIPLLQPRVIVELNDSVLVAMMPGPFSAAEMMRPNPFVPSNWLQGDG